MPVDREVKIVDVQMFRGGVLVTFSDDTTKLFDPQYLYHLEDQGGDLPVLESEPDSLAEDTN